MSDTLRHATIEQLAHTLADQRTRAVDVVVSAATLRAEAARLIVNGIEPHIDANGVTPVDGAYRLGGVGIEGLSDKLRIPLAYLRRLHVERTDLFDANVNGWLHGPAGEDTPDARRFLLRLLRHGGIDSPDVWEAGEPTIGTVRAVLSDGYRTIDNLDVALAALAGLREVPGLDVSQLVVSADLTERRMYVRVTSPQIAANAEALVREYRDPASGRHGSEYPLMWAGFVLANSEVGDGAFSITPRAVLQVCTNGQTITRDALRKVHAGAKLDEGVQWSADTEQANLELIKLQTRDAVAKFMSTAYVEQVVREIAERAGIELPNPPAVIQHVSRQLGYTQAQQADILNAFIRGADTTAGGLMHAVTYVAQHQADGDAASALEDTALQALQLAAARA